MNGRLGPAITALSLLTAIGAGITAAVGILARGDGVVETVTSARGEVYEMATTGVYANNAQRVVAEGIGWDMFTLIVAVPAMIVAAAFVARGSFRGRLVVAGLFGYFLYQYLEYAVTWAFGPLFLAFVVLYSMSLAGLGLVAVDVARAGRSDRSLVEFPRRAWPALLGTMSLLLTLLWLRRVFEGLTVGIDGLLLGETTMTVQALDLGLLVPISVGVAILAWRGGLAAATISAAYSVTTAALTAAITSMLVSAWIVEGAAEIPPLAMFGSATVIAAWLSVRIYRSLTPTADRQTPGHLHAGAEPAT